MRISPVFYSTIFALSTAYGKSGVAVFRVSGPEALAVLEKVSRRKACGFEARVMRNCRFFHPETREVLDRGLAVVFPEPKSFTGETCVELHVHGGIAVINSIWKALRAAGIRPAEPGEFTRRAFLNNKLDLTQVEALSDVIAAETKGQLSAANKQLSGRLSQVVDAWQSRLQNCMGRYLAWVDFGEEHHEVSDIIDNAIEDILALISEMKQQLLGWKSGERLRTGARVVIAGPPNVGKSSLLNRLVSRQAAIVSPIPGTTRDVIDIGFELGGFPVILSDIAGIRDTNDPIEKEGVTRAKNALRSADLILLLTETGPEFVSRAKFWLQENAPGLEGPKVLIVGTKADLADDNPDGISISNTTGFGMEFLLASLEKELCCLCGDTLKNEVLLNRQRHSDAVGECVGFLEEFCKLSKDCMDAAILVYKLNEAFDSLGRITGRGVDVEGILGAIFGEFCIGK